MNEMTGEYEERVFDLLDPDVRSKLAGFYREGRDPEDPHGDWHEFVTEGELVAAIRDAREHLRPQTMKLIRWKKLPTVAFRR